jgi:hypothetical protein
VSHLIKTQPSWCCHLQSRHGYLDDKHRNKPTKHVEPQRRPHLGGARLRKLGGRQVMNELVRTGMAPFAGMDSATRARLEKRWVRWLLRLLRSPLRRLEAVGFGARCRSSFE